MVPHATARTGNYYPICSGLNSVSYGGGRQADIPPPPKISYELKIFFDTGKATPRKSHYSFFHSPNQTSCMKSFRV